MARRYKTDLGVALAALARLAEEYQSTVRSEFETHKNRTPELDSEAYNQAMRCLDTLAIGKGK